MKTEIDYRDFLQNDPRYNEKKAWTEEKFPDAQYRYFCEAGCLVCSLAFLLRYHEIEKETDTKVFNPWILCEKLIGIGAFDSAADLEITAVSRLYPVGYLGVAEFSEEVLSEAAENGYACLLTVRGKNGPLHFIAMEKLTDDDAIVFDPKSGKRYLSEYSEIRQIRMFRLTDHIQVGYDYAFVNGRDELTVKKRNKVAIGFDDGPSKNRTGKVLDILKAYNVKATFFLVGKQICSCESLVQRMISEGHQIGVHGWSHLYLNALSEKECLIELKKTADEIMRAGGYETKVMRPPGGYANASVLKAARERNLSVIGWCVDSGDWKYGAEAQKTIDSVLGCVHDGDIILMHDNLSNTSTALEILIPKLIRRGLTPVTIDELAAESEEMKPGKIYNWF